MIKGLYETHINVTNLEKSITFYKEVLGLHFCHKEEKRRIAFFWIGKPKEFMLGLWEKQAEEMEKRHFAFRCDEEDILIRSVKYLKERSLEPYNFLNDETEKPMVFAWMPALANYFKGPNGKVLGFIGGLEGEANPELGVISYEEWKKASNT